MNKKLDDKLNFLEKGIGLSIIKDIKGKTSEGNFQDLETSLIKLNLLEKDGQLKQYEDILPWERGGAETYIATGKIYYSLYGENKIREFIAKAVVTFPMKPEDASNYWIEKFNLFSALGIKHPIIYSSYKAVLYQELLKEKLKDVWDGLNEFDKYNYSCEVLKIISALDACGYKPISYSLNDLMLKNGSVCVVDVGEDLGNFDLKSPNNFGYEAFCSGKFYIETYSKEFNELYTKHFDFFRNIIKDFE